MGMLFIFLSQFSPEAAGCGDPLSVLQTFSAPTQLARDVDLAALRLATDVRLRLVPRGNDAVLLELESPRRLRIHALSGHVFAANMEIYSRVVPPTVVTQAIRRMRPDPDLDLKIIELGVVEEATPSGRQTYDTVEFGAPPTLVAAFLHELIEELRAF